MAQRGHQRVDGHREPSLTQPPVSLTTFRAAPRQPQAQGQADHRPGQHRARRDSSALPALVFRSLLGCGARGRAGRTRAPPPGGPAHRGPPRGPSEARALHRVWRSIGSAEAQAREAQARGDTLHSYARGMYTHKLFGLSLGCKALGSALLLPPAPFPSQEQSREPPSWIMCPQRWESLKPSPREPQEVLECEGDTKHKAWEGTGV